jgi:hypothetical protein
MQARPEEVRVDDVDPLRRDHAPQGSDASDEGPNPAQTSAAGLGFLDQAPNGVPAVGELLSEEAVLEDADRGAKPVPVEALDQVGHKPFGPARHECRHHVQHSDRTGRQGLQ